MRSIFLPCHGGNSCRSGPALPGPLFSSQPQQSGEPSPHSSQAPAPPLVAGPAWRASESLVPRFRTFCSRDVPGVSWLPLLLASLWSLWGSQARFLA